MKSIKRIIAIMLTIVMLTTGFAFAGSASIISPTANSVATAESMLISVKMTAPGSIRVTVYEEKVGSAGSYKSVDTSAFGTNTLATASGSSYTEFVKCDTVTYTNVNETGFYTKKIAVEPGVYKLKVEVLGEDPEDSTKTIVTETYTSLTAIKKKAEEPKTSDIFTTSQSGTLKALQTFLKKVFH